MKTNDSSGGMNRVRTILFGLAAILAVIGVAEATYLTALDLSGADVVCIASSTCGHVLHSAYAEVHGIPLAALGGLGYFAVFSCATLAAFGYRRITALLIVIVGIMFGTTLWLLYVQAYVLHSFCDYCLFSAALVFLLAGVIIAIPRRVEG